MPDIVFFLFFLEFKEQSQQEFNFLYWSSQCDVKWEDGAFSCYDCQCRGVLKTVDCKSCSCTFNVFKICLQPFLVNKSAVVLLTLIGCGECSKAGGTEIWHPSVTSDVLPLTLYCNKTYVRSSAGAEANWSHFRRRSRSYERRNFFEEQTKPTIQSQPVSACVVWSADELLQ